MDPSMIPPEATIEPEPTAAAQAAPAASPAPTPAATYDHPPYAEMITAAIAALKEKDGSSRGAITKYIETQYSNLPPTHSSLLTQSLKRLNDNGQIIMVKHSYQLPRSTPVPMPVVANGAVNVPSDLDPVGPKRRPGRPPKPKPDSVQNAIPVFVNQSNMAVGPGSLYVSVGPVNGVAAAAGGVGVKRGRGRPPKQGGAGPIVPSKGPGGDGRPRGRPPKPKNVLGAVAVRVAPAKRRGRPPKAAVVLSTRKVNKSGRPSGRSVGRPKKNPSAATEIQAPDSEEVTRVLKGKIGYLQSRISHTVNAIRPCLIGETAVAGLLELEMLSTMDIDALPNINGPI